eukprot:363361-Chlamydomonas_euryale.AAC.7
MPSFQSLTPLIKLIEAGPPPQQRELPAEPRLSIHTCYCSICCCILGLPSTWLQNTAPQALSICCCCILGLPSTWLQNTASQALSIWRAAGANNYGTDPRQPSSPPPAMSACHPPKLYSFAKGLGKLKPPMPPAAALPCTHSHRASPRTSDMQACMC